MPTIDLSTDDGNAFALLAYARRFSKQLELDTPAILKEMMIGDYEHLVKTFKKYFGNFVNIIE